MRKPSRNWDGFFLFCTVASCVILTSTKYENATYGFTNVKHISNS